MQGSQPSLSRRARLRLRAIRLACCSALLIAANGIAKVELDAQSYAALSGYKAMAIHTGNPAVPYFAHGQQNKLAAATAAQRACRQANPMQNVEVGFCELVRLGDAELTTAAAIKQNVPQKSHPLYLWRYQSDHSTLYLGGSVHILKPGLYPLPVQYQQAFDAAERLVVEVNLAAYTPQQLQFKATQYGMLPDEQQLNQIMSPESHAHLSAVTAEYGLPLNQLARFKPSFITQQLAVLALMSVGYDPTQGVEKYFTDQAAGKEILELETIDFQLNLLMNQPLDIQMTMVRDTLEQMDEFEPFTAQLVTAWLGGDDASFQAAFDAQSGTSAESKAFMHQLMDERNVGMADKIAGYLRTPGTYFVLVGAAHYIGDNSIIKLLERQGIKGQRIYSDQNVAGPGAGR